MFLKFMTLLLKTLGCLYIVLLLDPYPEIAYGEPVLMYDGIFAEEDVALPRADYHSAILNRAKAEQTIARRNYFPEIWVWSDGATR